MLVHLALKILVAWQTAAGDERGQTLAEYGLIVSVIAVAITTLAVIAFRGSIIGAFDGASNCIKAGTAGASTC